MEKLSFNGMSSELAQYETPFADAPMMKEESDQRISSEDFFSDYIQEVESPFLRTYEATSGNNGVTQAGEEYVDLISELNDTEFSETLYGLANEMEDTWRSKISNEIAMGANYIPFATKQARDYFAPVIKDSEAMIDKIVDHFSGNNLGDRSEAEVEAFFSNLEFDHASYTPAQEQFFGKLFNKIKSTVKKGVELAKKGISIAGKFLPLNIILKKIKGLIRPLLDKVLKFAIGKLPKNLQPYAQTLAKKFLNLETVNETGGNNEDGESELDSIQTELDNQIAQLLFTQEESEADNLVNDYESSFEQVERANNYETGVASTPPIDVARQQFIDELKTLRDGESPAPAIEKFIPAAIKLGISVIGRPKVVNFIAGLLAKLVSKYVPANVARPLATSIVDVGMSAIGFETFEAGKPDLGYEAIANTVEETLQNLDEMDEATLNDSEAITLNLLEAFESAAADNFPAQYIKEELRPTKHKAVWVRMPRNSSVRYYKKFTHVYDITIDPQAASAVTTFRSLPLSNFLKDKYGLDPTKAVKARVHLYETLQKTRLSMISRYENLPGLNIRQPKAWIQLLPLTKQAASLLLKEPALGKDVDAKALSTRFRTTAGQRFYYLEIDGARLRIPPVSRSKHKHRMSGQPTAGIESRSGDVQAVINFIKSEIRFNYYFSEEDAKAVVERLNKSDFLGVAQIIRESVKNVLHDILSKNITTKVKIVHEALPELYLENYSDQQEQFAPLDALGKLAGKEIITTLVEKLIEKVSTPAYEAVLGFLKARAAEFKTAQAEPQDGVTVKLTWGNITGMSTIRTVINAIRGKLSLGNLGDLSFPALPAPTIQIVADKKFD